VTPKKNEAPANGLSGIKSTAHAADLFIVAIHWELYEAVRHD
jgi:hypothetical protein